MSEQPNNVASLDDYRTGSRLDNDTHVDLHKNTTVSDYNAEEIAEVHQMEAVRQAREAAVAAEQNTRKSGPEIAEELLTNLSAVRRAAEAGKIELINHQSNVIGIFSRTAAIHHDEERSAA